MVIQRRQTSIDEATRYAYRYILYWATLELRMIGNLVYRPAGLFNPFRWRPAVRQARRTAALADWMHNLALFSALEFDRFEEDRFWREYERLVVRYPEFRTYKYWFDRQRSEYRPPEGAA